MKLFTSGRLPVPLLLKLGFSAVILQLLYISIIVTGDLPAALAGTARLCEVPEMLENAAVTALCVLGGGLLWELAVIDKAGGR